MKAVVAETYGSPNVLQYTEVETPVPGDGEVRIRIHAASVNSWDWDLLRGQLINRLIFMGLLKPAIKILGADIAGEVVALGRNVSSLKVGDRVCGDLSAKGWGGYAEYVCADASVWTRIPDTVSFQSAAALPQAGVMAYQSLKEKRAVKAGDSILINGAGGGVGTYMIQIAKNLGAEVTAVDSAGKLDFLSSLGADHVIDYRQEDFTKNGKQYDLIVDVVSVRSVFEYQQSLTADGEFVMVGGKMSAILKTAIFGPMISRKNGKKFSLLAHEPNKYLDELLAMLAQSKMQSIIDGPYALKDTAAAISKIGAGNALGKLVIQIP